VSISNPRTTTAGYPLASRNIASSLAATSSSLSIRGRGGAPSRHAEARRSPGGRSDRRARPSTRRAPRQKNITPVNITCTRGRVKPSSSTSTIPRTVIPFIGHPACRRSTSASIPPNHHPYTIALEVYPSPHNHTDFPHHPQSSIHRLSFTKDDPPAATGATSLPLSISGRGAQPYRLPLLLRPELTIATPITLQHSTAVTAGGNSRTPHCLAAQNTPAGWQWWTSRLGRRPRSPSSY
jgi:hypothetical protein